MALSTHDFWRLLKESQLWSAADYQKLQQRFADTKEAPPHADAAALAKWLIAQNALTRYQAKILLGGRAGPFVYGDYLLRERIAEGRLAGFFKAVHVATQHPVLLWFIKGALAQNVHAYAAMANQVALAIQAVDPCLWQTYEIVDSGKYKFIVLEDLSGSTADDLLATRGRLDTAEACRVMRHVALGLSALHSHGATHGEIRPGNVWIDSQGNGVLMQLPLTRDPHLPPSSPLDPTLSESQLQTIADYSAPELAFEGHAPDPLSDVYAVGCTLYHLLSGRPPFPGGDVATKLQRHATEAIEPLEPLGVPASLAKVVAYAMAKDRRVRYPSAAQLADALAYFIDPANAQTLPQHATTASAYETRRQTTIDNDDDVDPHDDRIPIGIVDPTVATGAAEEIRRQRLRARKNHLGKVLFFLALLVAGGLGYTAYYLNRPPETALPVDEPGSSADGQIAAAETTLREASRTTGTDSKEEGNHGDTSTVADDGKTRWASPTMGPPISWAYLPARAEVVLALRPAELLRHPEGAKLLSALGPLGQQARAALEDAAGVPASEMEHLIIAWSHTSSGWTPTYVVKVTAPIQPEMLVAKYQSSAEMSHGSEKYFVAGNRAYAAPNAEQGRTVITSAADQMQEILARGRNSAPLSREMVKLLQTSDSQRLVTLLFEKDALITQAQAQFDAAGLSPLRDAMSWLLDEDARAAALSLHLAEECYLEARMVGVVDTTAGQLIETLRARMKRLTSDVEAYLGRIDFHPYGKRVLLRFARMAEFVQEQLRLETEGDQVVINAYLPAVAAHNLALGAELAISQPSGQAISETPVDTNPADRNPATVADKLKRPISFVQQLDTLENAIRAISAEIGVPIEVLGADLQPEGITRNNQFGVEARDRPASDVLRAVLLKANPEGKLVYVIKPKSPGGEEMIFVTTRAAAARRGDKLAVDQMSE